MAQLAEWIIPLLCRIFTGSLSVTVLRIAVGQVHSRLCSPCDGKNASLSTISHVRQFYQGFVNLVSTCYNVGHVGHVFFGWLLGIEMPSVESREIQHGDSVGEGHAAVWHVTPHAAAKGLEHRAKTKLIKKNKLLPNYHSNQIDNVRIHVTWNWENTIKLSQALKCDWDSNKTRIREFQQVKRSWKSE